MTCVLQGLRSCHCGSSHLSSAELTLRVSYNIPHHAFHFLFAHGTAMYTSAFQQKSYVEMHFFSGPNDGSCCILPMVEVYFSALRYMRLVTLVSFTNPLTSGSEAGNLSRLHQLHLKVQCFSSPMMEVVTLHAEQKSDPPLNFLQMQSGSAQRGRGVDRSYKY